MILGMRRIFIHIIIFIIAVNLFGKGYYVIEKQGENTSFNTVILNETEYIDMRIIANKFFVGAKYDNQRFAIHIDNDAILQFAPSGSFVSLEKKSDTLVFQMRKPAIYYGNMLLVPLNSFLLSLEILEIYSVNSDSNRIMLVEKKMIERNDKMDELTKKYQPYLIKNEKSVAEDNFVNDKKKNNKENKKSEKHQQENISEVMENKNLKQDVNTPPNVYKLPKNINRDEIIDEDKKQNKKIVINDDELYITKYYLNNGLEEAKLYLYANNVITEYKKPEISDSLIVIKIPNAKNGISKFVMNKTYGGVKDISVEMNGSMLKYTICSNQDIFKVESSRNGPKELVFTIIFDSQDLKSSSKSD